MPFTPAHPAAVLPFLRRASWVSAGLITGSIAPDLPTYVPLGLTHNQTHPLTAIVWPDGLIALGALLAWWGPLRPALLSLWPAAARRCGPAGWRDPAIRRTPLALASWLGWLVASELVGLASHLLWDGFTHGDGFFVLRIAALRGAFDGHAIYNLLQFWCSVVGILIVAIYLSVQWRRRDVWAPAAGSSAPPSAPSAPSAPTLVPLRPAIRVGVVLTVVAVTAFTALWTGHQIPQPFAWHRHWLWRHRVVNAGGVFILALAAWAALLGVVTLARAQPRQSR